MPKQKPPSPEDKFKELKKEQGVPLDETKKKPLVTKPKAAEEVKPFSDGKEASISQNITEELKVDIRNRKEQFYDGTAKTVSSINDTGEFDVLPKHANFVTLIRGYVIVDRGLPSEKKFEVDNGVLAAKTGAVDVYLDF